MFENELQHAFSPALEIFWDKAISDDRKSELIKLGFFSNEDIQEKAALCNAINYEEVIKTQPSEDKDSDKLAVWRINTCSAMILSHTQLSINQLKELSKILGISLNQLCQLSVALGKEDLARILINNDPDMVSANEFAVFRFSAASGQQPLLEYIAKCSPNLLQAMIKVDNCYAFRHAAHNGHLRVMLYLAEQASNQLLSEIIINNNSYSFEFKACNGHLYVKEIGLSDDNNLHVLEYKAEQLPKLIAIDNLELRLSQMKPSLQVFRQKYPNRFAQFNAMLENNFIMARSSLEKHKSFPQLSRKKEELIAYVEQLKAEGSESIVTLVLVLQKTRSLLMDAFSDDLPTIAGTCPTS